MLLRILSATPQSSISPGNLPHVSTGADTVSNILAITFVIVGALALLMVTISGLRYITSAGDPEKTAGAKSGIVYSLVGLVIAIMAEAIVAFIVGRL